MKYLTNAKKVLALALSIVLCVSLYVPAFAVDQTSISLVPNQNKFNTSDATQQVTVDIKTSEAVSIDSLQYTVVLPDGWTATLDLDDEITGAVYENNLLTWYYTGAADTNVEGITSLGTLTVTIPASEDAGNYDIRVTGLDVSANQAYWAQDASYETSITIAEAGAYTVSVSAPATATVDDDVTATVTVAGSEFASAQLELTYNSTLLQYTSIEGLGENGAVDTSVAGVIKIVDAGATKTDNSYKIKFKALAAGTADVTISNGAKFSTLEDAATSDLTLATITTATASVLIKVKSFAVTLPDGDWFTGNSAIDNGSTYTFTATKWANYDYYTVYYSVAGGAPQEVTPDANGLYTIENVTGVLAITTSKTPTAKQHNVAITGDTAANDGVLATYGTPYTFTLPNDLAPGLSGGYTYSLGSITIGGEAYTGHTISGRVYTINGAHITGDIAIVIVKTPLAANQFTVTAAGTGAGDAAIEASPVNTGSTAKMTLTKDANYTYSVSVTMGGSPVEPTVVDNVYTVAGVTANVVFTVTKTITVTSATATDYTSLKVGKAWLVKIGDTKLADQVYTYDGNNMFWSDNYSAYCYLVAAETAPAVTADKFAIVSGTAVEIDYGRDVNKTGSVDANDAQFVYNMYNATYEGFTSDVSVEKFLRADVINDGILSVADANNIVSSLLG